MNSVKAMYSLYAITSAWHRPISDGKNSHNPVTTTNVIASGPETAAGNLHLLPLNALLTTISIDKHTPWRRKKHVRSHVGFVRPM